MKFIALLLFILSVRTQGSQAVEFSEARANGKRVTVCKVDVHKESIGLFLHDENGQVFGRFDPLAATLKTQGRSLVFAMNAGMFHPGQLPVGLFVADGRTLYPLNLSVGEGNFFLKPNGVFLISDQRARVIESSEFPRIAARERVALATQSGPLLVHNGMIHPSFSTTSTSRLIRNGVGVSTAGAVLFVISEEQVTLYEFAALFRDVLHCSDALFLDGSVSSLYAPALKRNDFRMGLGPLIAVVE